MALVPKKVQFTGGKIIETPDSTGVAKEVTTLAGTLTSQIECVHFSARINPSVVNEQINLGNISTAKLLVLVPSAEVYIRFNSVSGQPIPLAAGPTLLTGTISGVFATNASSSTAVDIEVYASSDVG